MVDKADGELSNGIFWGSTFALAAFATFFTSEIKAVNGVSYKNINWYCTVFTIGFVVLVIYSALISYAKKQSEIKSIEEIKTNPPSDFWMSYASLYNNSQKNLDDLPEVEDQYINGSISKDDFKEKIEVSVNYTLSAILRLVTKWDYSILQGDVIYWANIMVKHEVAINGQPNGLLQSASSTIDFSSVKGEFEEFMWFEKDFCIKFNGEFVLDKGNGDVVLPILPDKYRYNIPGAPLSIASGQFSYVDDSATISEKYAKTADIVNRNLQSELEKYYTSNKNKGRSILSLPCQQRYVVSIYRNKPNMLYAGSKAEDFSYISLPFSNIIADQLYFYYAMKEKHNF